MSKATRCPHCPPSDLEERLPPPHKGCLCGPQKRAQSITRPHAALADGDYGDGRAGEPGRASPMLSASP